MSPAGYMLKQTTLPEDFSIPGVTDIYSASGCICRSLADVIDPWNLNSFRLADTPHLFTQAPSTSLDTSGMNLFYYDIFEEEFDENSAAWRPFNVDVATHVTAPAQRQLQGYDVVTFSGGGGAECSPLSCNSLAAGLVVNHHCLFDSFEEAKAAVEAGGFNNSEPGPFRILGVYTFSA